MLAAALTAVAVLAAVTIGAPQAAAAGTVVITFNDDSTSATAAQGDEVVFKVAVSGCTDGTIINGQGTTGRFLVSGTAMETGPSHSLGTASYGTVWPIINPGDEDLMNTTYLVHMTVPAVAPGTHNVYLAGFQGASCVSAGASSGYISLTVTGGTTSTTTTTTTSTSTSTSTSTTPTTTTTTTTTLPGKTSPPAPKPTHTCPTKPVLVTRANAEVAAVAAWVCRIHVVGGAWEGGTAVVLMPRGWFECPLPPERRWYQPGNEFGGWLLQHHCGYGPTVATAWFGPWFAWDPPPANSFWSAVWADSNAA